MDFAKDIKSYSNFILFSLLTYDIEREAFPTLGVSYCPTSSGPLSNQNAPPNPSVSTVQRALRATEALQPRTVVRDRLLHRPIRHRGGVLVSGTLAPLRRQLSHTLIPGLRARFIRPGRSEKVVPEDGVGGEIVLR